MRFWKEKNPGNCDHPKRNREKGTSYLVYYKDPLHGKRKYYRTFRRLRAAQRVANDLRTLLDAGNTG